MARSSRRTAANKRSIRVDFTNAGQSRFLPPEDDYVVEIVKVEQSESSSGNSQLTLDFAVLDGKHKGKQFRQWFSLVDQALWKLAGVLRSAGVEIPEEPVDLDFDDIEGRKLQVTVEHREYNGDTKVDIRDSAALDEVEEEEEEEAPKRSSKRNEEPSRRSSKREEEDAPKSNKSKKGPPKITADEVSDLDEDGLEDVIERYGLDIDLSSFKTLRKKIAAVIDGLETEGHLEEE